MSDKRHLDDLIVRGIGHCRAEEWEMGLQLLGEAFSEGSPHTPRAGLASSFLGYGLALQGSRTDGLRLCKRAVQMEFCDADVHLNLARVHLLRNERREAVKVLEHGLVLDPDHTGLLELRRLMGLRQAPPVPFLKRSNPLNRMLGRVLMALKGSAPRTP